MAKINLTPKKIYEQEFKTSMRGYDKKEVDEFLDDVIKDYGVYIALVKELQEENAKLNGLTNCIFYCGDMKEVFTEEFLAQHPKADVLITDPPRDGMHPKVVEQILKLSPNRIVYVSCNSATQARDLALMKDFYRVEKILPVDMFPQTHHVENIALLTKK